MMAVLPDQVPDSNLSLAAGPAALRAAQPAAPSASPPAPATRSRRNLGALPWRLEEKVLLHRRATGILAIWLSGIAFAAADGWPAIGLPPAVQVAALVISIVLVLEGIVLAFPRPTADPVPVPSPPPGASL